MLDVKLDGDMTISLASTLLDRNLPILLSTGYESDMPERLPKPFSETLFQKLAREQFAPARSE